MCGAIYYSQFAECENEFENESTVTERLFKKIPEKIKAEKEKVLKFTWVSCIQIL